MNTDSNTLSYIHNHYSNTYCNFAHQNNPYIHIYHCKHHMTSHILHLNIGNHHHMDKIVNLSYVNEAIHEVTSINHFLNVDVQYHPDAVLHTCGQYPRVQLSLNMSEMWQSLCHRSITHVSLFTHTCVAK